jgi:hypothetical protein
MIILGTRTSALGSILIAYAAIAIYIGLAVFRCEKFEIKKVVSFFIPLALLTLFYYNSPFYFSRTRETQVKEELKVTAPTESLLKLEEEPQDEKQEEEQSNTIMTNLYAYRINEVFTEIYPVKNDIQFWIKLCKRELYLNNDNRQMKIDILRRIKERNNNKVDDLLGLGYTLNFMDVERDYVYQYLLFGGIGVILFLGIYFIIFGKNLVTSVKHMKKAFKFNVGMSFMAPCVVFVIAYYSGHVFGWVSPMMYLSFVLGFLNYYVGDTVNES